MDIQFLEEIISQLMPYLSQPQTNPYVFNEFSALLLKFVRIIPLFSIHTQLNPLLIFDEKTKYQTMIENLQSAFFLHFQQNSLVKHYLTAASRVFTSESTFYITNEHKQIIFSINLTRYLIWSWQKSVITYLDIISYVFMINKSISGVQFDYASFYSKDQLTTDVQLELISHYQILQQLFQTELERNEQVEYLLRLIKCSDIAWQINLLYLNQNSEANFEKQVLAAYDNLDIFAQYSLVIINQQLADQREIIEDQIQDIDIDAYYDLMTQYQTFCDIKNKQKTMQFLKLNIQQEIVLILMQISSQCIVQLQDYIYLVTATIYQQQQVKTIPITTKFKINKDDQIKKLLYDQKFVFFYNILYKPLMGNQILTNETNIFSDMFMKLFQVEYLLRSKRIEQTSQLSLKNKLQAVYAFDLQQTMYFGMTRYFDNIKLKNIFVILKYAQAIQLKQQFRIKTYSDFDKFIDVQGIQTSDIIYTHNLAKLFMDQSSFGRVKDYFKIQYINQMTSNFLKEREIKLYKQPIFDFLKQSTQELRIFSTSSVSLIISNNTQVFIPFITNIKFTIESFFDQEELVQAFSSDEIAQIAIVSWFFEYYSQSWKLIKQFIKKRDLSPTYLQLIQEILKDYTQFFNKNQDTEQEIEDLVYEYL
uniref:Uncharacterized protein n=1 Tax=Spironucleus salmonicida TaxID=348837 RepID=V6LSY7_9EUKA|eukprot:EST43909.1 Hypothetical protein SS50377_16209 [Spironucleus salmonicida]